MMMVVAVGNGGQYRILLPAQVCCTSVEMSVLILVTVMGLERVLSIAVEFVSGN